MRKKENRRRNITQFRVEVVGICKRRVGRNFEVYCLANGSGRSSILLGHILPDMGGEQ